MFLSQFGLFWSVIEASILLISVFSALYLFLIDPVRRWRFFGFRPTTINVFYDPRTKKILLIKAHDKWGFIQGGIYSNNLYQSVEQAVTRELGLSTNHYELKRIKPIGSRVFQNKGRIKDIDLGVFSISRKLIGKGYVACYLSCNLNRLAKHIKLGYGVDKFETFQIDEAEKTLIEQQGVKDKKRHIFRKAFDELRRLL